MERKGETGWFSVCPNQAMEWLISHSNALLIMSHIIILKGYNGWHHGEDLEDDEIIIYLKKIKTKPQLSMAQLKRVLDNLSIWGFIEIMQCKLNFRGSGKRKLKVLHNPFDTEVIQYCKNEYQGGYSPHF